VTEPTEPNVGSAVVCLMVGLRGAGKTYRAKELEISASALRLTPDEWQIALFGDQTFMALAGRPWMDETRGAAR
jgi:predicted kinase